MIYLDFYFIKKSYLYIILKKFHHYITSIYKLFLFILNIYPWFNLVIFHKLTIL